MKEPELSIKSYLGVIDTKNYHPLSHYFNQSSRLSMIAEERYYFFFANNKELFNQVLL